MTDLNELKEFLKNQLILEGLSNYAQVLQDINSDDPEMSLEMTTSLLKDFLKEYTKKLNAADSIEAMWEAGVEVGAYFGCFMCFIDEDDFQDFLKKIAKWTKRFERFEGHVE